MRYVREGRYRLDMFASEGRYRLAIFARGVTASLLYDAPTGLRFCDMFVRGVSASTYSRGALPPRYYMTPLQGYDDAICLQGAFPLGFKLLIAEV